jgi:signal transduction histidine kinase
MMKEILTNTIKNAAQLEITYSDAIKGFDTPTILREAKGLGLRNIIS